MKQPTAIRHSGRRQREAARRRTDVLAVVGTVNATAAEWIESGRDEPLSNAAPGICEVVERLLVEVGEEGST